MGLSAVTKKFNGTARRKAFDLSHARLNAKLKKWEEAEKKKEKRKKKKQKKRFKKGVQ